MKDFNTSDFEASQDVLIEKCLDGLMQKDQLAYMGNFVRGFAHNINGMLQNISMLSEILTRSHLKAGRLPDSEPEKIREWEEAHEAQNRRFEKLSRQIALLTDMLKDLTILYEIQCNDSEVDINQVLDTLTRVFRADLFFKHQVELKLRTSSKLPLMRILGKDLIPALVHLFENALTAMQTTDQKRLLVETTIKDEVIEIIFRDTGCGFTHETDSGSLFDLFHSEWNEKGESCKGQKNFLGFGLYAARRRLSPYGATIRLERKEEETWAVIEIPT